MYGLLVKVKNTILKEKLIWIADRKAARVSVEYSIRVDSKYGTMVFDAIFTLG